MSLLVYGSEALRQTLSSETFASTRVSRPDALPTDAGRRDETAQLDQIVRQKNTELLRAVQHLAKDETERGVALLREQGLVTEITSGPERIQAIARDYASKPEGTIIVSPDNKADSS